ncbi:hypothetical protein M3P36_05525 [Altererythrobacter sp. KTW20L]|uniref:hypothetical protein n=1 Tax=Altererythrobacter sp. KTW20L TaxID=2942210 RepID=UPI0020C010AC|nr:hypothetical protein [Altererythrobacter sp. KTW20L]MCL6250504.1 hypothetical protein [Altererythrobacter sp. KTW20L]
MNQSFTFLDARAREAEAEAARATLDNVRERAMRSATTWRTMADKALKVESDRARAEVERLARKADELAQEQAAQLEQEQVAHYSQAAE